MDVPACTIPVLSTFRPVFSTPTYHRFLVLVLAAVLTTGRRTITNLLRTVRYQTDGHVSSSHRVFSQRRWSTWALGRTLISFLLDHVVPPGPVLLAGDDTVTEHPGLKVFGKGRHRDGVRSTHSYTAYRWGHKWVVVSVLVKLPFANRPWALPVLVALYRPPEWNRVHGMRHKTPAHMARLLLARLMRWFPTRHFIFVGDSGYGTSETARFCSKHHGHLTLVSRFYGDAALYAPPPPRTRKTMGRPRVKGQKLATPQEAVADTAKRTRLMVAWYGGTTRDIEVVTGSGHWYRIGEDVVAVRWVYVHDCSGTHRDEYFFTTETAMKPRQIVECYTQRWSIETTFQECREYLKLESTKGYSAQTVLRFTPCLFGLYTLVVRLYLQLPHSLSTCRALFWKGKSTVTFSDMMTCVRRALWVQWYFYTQADAQQFSKLPRLLQDTILYALAPAA
jgi:DDE superfamily endonuclease